MEHGDHPGARDGLDLAIAQAGGGLGGPAGADDGLGALAVGHRGGQPRRVPRFDQPPGQVVAVGGGKRKPAARQGLAQYLPRRIIDGGLGRTVLLDGKQGPPQQVLDIAPRLPVGPRLRLLAAAVPGRLRREPVGVPAHQLPPEPVPADRLPVHPFPLVAPRADPVLRLDLPAESVPDGNGPCALVRLLQIRLEGLGRLHESAARLLGERPDGGVGNGIGADPILPRVFRPVRMDL